MEKLQNRSKGFTIIELLIVLAIAALIILIVLIAVPQLQRNQRNQARQSILNRVTTEVNNYSGNNNGRIPTSATDITGFTTRYLTGVNRQDPQSGTDMGVTWLASSPAGGAAPAGAEIPAIGSIFYKNGYTCNGEILNTANARNFAIWTQLEGGAIYCLDNE
jgi:prepilin-type N-terminal cleavage/methylation domain-containing protein